MGKSYRAISGLTYRASDRETAKMENTVFSDTLLANLRERGFVLDVICTAQFVTLWPQTMSLLPSVMNVLGRGGREEREGLS